MSGDFYREERTRTVVRHVIAAPALWTDVQKLLRAAFRDMGCPVGASDPPDDAVWYEADEESLAICYELVSGSNGGVGNREPLR